MATNMDKALYEAPIGMEDIVVEEEVIETPPLEIEIEDPESVTVGIGGVDILEINKEEELEESFDANLAEEMSDNELQTIASDLIGCYEEDVASRKDWIQTFVDGLDLLGMKIEDRTEPWNGACGVTHPLLSETLVKFQSETMMETFPATGPVKTKIIGKETAEKKEAAERVQEDMNYRITEKMPEYRPEQERMLWGLGLSGNAFKKIYYDPNLERPTSTYVPAEDVVVPYGATSLQTAERVTHVMRKTENELRKLQVSGFYCDVNLGEPSHSFDEVEKRIAEKMGFRATSDDRYRILEMHVDLDLVGYEDVDKNNKPTGIALPYVVTIEKSTQTILAIRRNWVMDDDLKKKRNHFVHYGYIPGFGFYYFGLIHLIGAFAKSGTSILRQLVDAGTLSNLPGGLKSRGLRVKGDDTPITPGEFRDVDVPSGSIRENILPLPYKEPSQVLAGLMNQIIEEGRRFASAADMKVSDMSAQAPVGTTLAILERTLKIMSAVQARIHYSMQEELRLLKSIIRDYTPSDYGYQPSTGDREIKQSDYDQCDVIPVSNPNAATMSQKVVQYQAVLQLAQTAPQLYDLPLLHRQMLDVMGIHNYQKLVPMEDDVRPRDPITENQNVLMLKPVKAFLYQDHQAHIQVHSMAMQDPKVQATLAQNPQAQQMMAELQAHIAEHLGFEYRKQMEATMGVTLPNYEEDEEIVIPKEMEVEISKRAAEASQILLQQNLQEAQQQENQEQLKDPVVQMQMQELAIKKAEQERKVAKDLLDAQARQKQLQIDQERVEVEKERIDSQIEIAGANLAAKHEQEMEKLNRKQESEGFKAGLDSIKKGK